MLSTLMALLLDLAPLTTDTLAVGTLSVCATNLTSSPFASPSRGCALRSTQIVEAKPERNSARLVNSVVLLPGRTWTVIKADPPLLPPAAVTHEGAAPIPT